ncbi:MAG: hotdog domain-containing protein [Paludibacter sp.]|nr:hotdog domain-containing protein [Paludibacter sp.]
MIEHEYQFRVAYPDTDRMGTVHHANYVKYYEVARWELLRSIVLPYAELEALLIRMTGNFRNTLIY